MIKSITKIGNSQGIIFDAAIMDMAHLKVGDEINITVHEGGAIIITPTRTAVSIEESVASAREWIGKNKELFHRLSQ